MAPNSARHLELEDIAPGWLEVCVGCMWTNTASTAVPLARVRRVASEERLTEIYYNEKGGVLSFAPTFCTAVGVDGAASDALTRVNVYYTTGTVATVDTHLCTCHVQKSHAYQPCVSGPL